ncbi:MAG: hypothetical protein Q7S89_00150, partial [bacterium]|nr:hypothetical protein [bacterium]
MGATDMKIAMSLLSGVGYGGKTYFFNLIPELARIDLENEYHFFVASGDPLTAAVSQSNVVFHESIAHNQSAIKRFLYEQVVLPRMLARYKIDIFFSAKNITLFFAPCKTVIAIRNMEPFFYTHYESSWKMKLLSWVKYQLT